MDTSSRTNRSKRLNGWLVTAILAGIAIILLVGFRLTCVTFVDNYEFGFGYNHMNGKIEVLGRTGYIIRWPLIYSVHTIDLRPYQVSITPGIIDAYGRPSTSSASISSRVLNAKLVRFNPEGLSTFIEWHGRAAGDNLNNLLTILKAYAFDRDEGRDCPFLTIMNELTPKQQTPTPVRS